MAPELAHPGAAVLTNLEHDDFDRARILSGLVRLEKQGPFGLAPSQKAL